MMNSDDLYGMELDRRLAAEQALAAVAEVVEAYESCGPKQQSTRDVLAAVRAAFECSALHGLDYRAAFYRVWERCEELKTSVAEHQYNALEMARKADLAERRAEESEFHVEQLRDARDSAEREAAELRQQQPFRVAEQNRIRAEAAERRIERAERLIDGWEQDGPDDPVVRLIIQRVRETLNHPKPESAVDGCPLGKASCDPLANGCDGECESEWLSYACTASNHAACSGVAWQPGIPCDCKCHSEASLPPTGGVS